MTVVCCHNNYLRTKCILCYLVDPRPARSVGSIHDYDPMAEQNPQSFQQAKQWQESVPDPHSK